MTGFSLLETIVILLLLGIIWGFAAIQPANFSKNNLAIKQAIALVRQKIVASSWEQTKHTITTFNDYKINKLSIKSKDNTISFYANHSCSPALITHRDQNSCSFTLSLRCNIRLLC